MTTPPTHPRTAAWLLALALALPLAAAPGLAGAAITTHASRSSFAAAVGPGGTDSFDDLPLGGTLAAPLARQAGGLGYLVQVDPDTAFTDAGAPLPPGLAFGAGSAADRWLSTNSAGDTLRLDHLGVRAIGGAFFGSDVDGAFLPGVTLALVATDGSGSHSFTLAQPAAGQFFGLVSDSPLLQLTVRALQPASGSHWLGVNDLVLADPVPEPGSAALLLAGLLALGAAVRRRSLPALAGTTLAAAAALALPPAALAQADETGNLRHGKLFTSSNATTGNEVLVYARNAAGAATLLSRHATNGLGTGAALGSQGAVALSRDGQHLFVVNAASATVATFSLANGGISLVSTVPSGGTTPTSITERAGLVVVLNAGGDGSLASFRNVGGVLTPLADGLRGLSQAGGTAPAQVSFNSYGDALVVSERATSRLTSYSVLADGTLARRGSTASAGSTPFGFAFTPNDTLVVSEAAASTVSSYRFVDNSRIDAPRLVSGTVPTQQGAACWVAVAPGGRIAYSANAASSSISSFSVARDGRLALLQSVAGSTGTNAGALDTAVTPDGQQLHVLAPRAPALVAFRAAGDGTLQLLGTVSVPQGSAGLAVN